MLSDNALLVASALRHFVGPDNTGVGPDTRQLLELTDLPADELRSVLEELKSYGFINIDTVIGVDTPGIPKALRDMAGIQVMEPMQAYFDNLG